MSGDNLSRKLSTTSQSRNILEFGSGGSTFLFANTAKQVISIESDKRFASYINSQLGSLGLTSKAKVLYANIGPTKSFGQPINFLKPFFKNRYPQYTNVFFEDLNLAFEPDVVFVDGRSRVWCALQSCMRIQSDFILLVDDFFNRPEYQDLEIILGQATSYSGNTAIFQVTRESFKVEHVKVLAKYKSDYR